MKITGRQIVAARGLLAWTQDQLAVAADVDKTTVQSIEKGLHAPRAETLEKIRGAIEARGIEFTNGDNPGVRLVREKAASPLH